MTRLVLFAAALLLSASNVFAGELPKPLVDAYLRAQSALASDSTAGLPDAASAIEGAAQPLGADAAAVVGGAKKLKAAATLADARSAFGELSSALVDYATKTNATLPGDLHVAFCPMNSKPWMQRGTEIKNPYYGTAMLSCGVLKK